MNRTSTALPSASYQANVRKVTLLALLVLLAAVCYMVVAVNFGNQQLMLYSMKIRTPKLVVMLITAFAIGGASIVFQSIINNTIVTPCLLGMNSLYTLIHTAVVFFAGSGSLLARNANLSFAADVILMGIVATIIYSYLFQKTNHNVLYVLLIGTVLSSFFSSIQTTLTRVMDPNEYDSLLSTLVADFENINSEIIVFALVLLAGLIFVLRRDLALLDVLTLGKHQAINLGVDYDRSIRRLLLGRHPVHRGGHRHGGPHLLPRPDYRQHRPSALQDLPPHLSDSGLRPGGHGGAGGGTACGGAYLPLRGAHQRVHHRGRRHLLSLSSFVQQEGVNPCVSRI